LQLVIFWIELGLDLLIDTK